MYSCNRVTLSSIKYLYIHIQVYHIIFIAVVQNVLRKQHHKHEGQKLKLSIYRHRLGVIPPGHDTNKPIVQIPQDIIIKDLDHNLVQYLKKVEGGNKSAEIYMKQQHAQIDWAHGVETELHVVCTLKKDMTNLSSLALEWKHKVEVSVKEMLANITMKTRDCLKKTWKDVCSEVNKMKGNNSVVAILENPSDNSLCIVGPHSEIDKVFTKVDKLCKQIEEQSEHITDSTGLNQTEMAIIEKVKLIESIKKKHKGLKVTLDKSNSEIIFEGTPRQLLVAQKDLTMCIKQIQKRQVSMDKGRLKILTLLKQKPDNQIDIELHKSGLRSIIQIQRGQVEIAGINGDVDQAEQLLHQQLKEAIIYIPEKEVSALSDNIWQQFSKNLFADYNGMIHVEISEDQRKVSVAGLVTDIEGALESVKRHLQKNAIREELIGMQKPYVRMINQWSKKDLNKIEQDFSRYNLTIKAQINPSLETGFLVCGTEDGLKNAVYRIRQLAEVLVFDIHTISTPGMPFYFTERHNGKFFIKGLENEYKVIIEPDEKDNQKSVTRMQPGKVTSKEQEQALGEVKHATGVYIKVYVGDMTEHKVDVIVNAANGDLHHIGGLAKSILEKGSFMLLVFKMCTSHIIPVRIGLFC